MTTSMSTRSVPCAEAWLLTLVGGRRLVIDLDLVAAVDAVGPVARLPGPPSALRGVTQWRGRLLTLLDAGRLFGGAPCAGRQMVVLRGLAVETALAVDEIVGPAPPGESPDDWFGADEARNLPALQPGFGPGPGN